MVVHNKGEGDKVKFTDLGSEKRQVQGSGNKEEGKTLNRLQIVEINDDLWDRFRRLGS